MSSKALSALLLAGAAAAAWAQGAPGLPPAPTPTALYPGGAMGASSSSYTTAEGLPLSTGQSLYLPVHSCFHHGEIDPRTGKPPAMPVSAHVGIRNTDPRMAMKVTSARYYDADGKLLREFLAAPRTIPPYGTHELHLARPDAAGASFVIEWSAERPINPPLVEALHTDIRETRALLFVTTARPIQTR